MNEAKPTNLSEEDVMKLAEASREEWEKSSVLKEMFMGKFSFLPIDHAPEGHGLTDPIFLKFYENYKKFLTEEVDADLIDLEGKIPAHLIERLKSMKLFALKIDKTYGGHGFTQTQYNAILQLTASVDANISALLSAHQSIGVPQPLLLFGTPLQKEKYLTRIVAGQISAFALTENNVGSDPANLLTTVKEQGDSYLLNGKKLWCTNVLVADVIVVMARHPENDSISAFIVEMNWPGVQLINRCHFMGLRALENGVVSFTDVIVPKENLLGEKGKGLKLALVTLNTGRLALPASIVGLAKKNLEIARHWSRQREQWGKPIYKHEAIAHKIADIAAATFAIESVSILATALYETHQDIRLEAAVAKLFASEAGWNNIDELLQIRGGRGYETAASLKARGEADLPVERFMRDFRINRIFEGTTEIMHLFIAREAVDMHLKISGVLLDRQASLAKKMSALPRMALFYLSWYPKLWVSWNSWPRFQSYGSAATHLRFIRGSSKKLARQIFHGMLLHGPKLQNKQAFLFRIVDIAVLLYVMAASLARARKLEAEGNANALILADLFCRNSTIKIQKLFDDLWSNTDNAKYSMAQKIENDEFVWMEKGIVPISAYQNEKLKLKL